MAVKVGVIVTVFNEQESINSLLVALKNQTLKPHQVVIVDGGSTDGTLTLLKSFSRKWSTLKVYSQTGNRSVGRNFAISKCLCPIIAITDAGCRPHSDWLQNITRPFMDSQVQVVSGYYRGEAENIFQKCLIPFVLVMPDKAEKTEFFPSTRSMALRREVWVKSGGFNPALWHNEDYAFAHLLKRLGYSFHFNSQALVSWYPRKDLQSAAWMFLRFAVGDIQAGIIRPRVKSLFMRFLGFVYLFFFFIELRLYFFPFLILLTYFVWAIIKNYRYVRHPLAFFWLPVLQITCDVCVLFGSIMGALSRV